MAKPWIAIYCDEQGYYVKQSDGLDELEVMTKSPDAVRDDANDTHRNTRIFLSTWAPDLVAEHDATEVRK